jgi:hypothetical protein
MSWMMNYQLHLLRICILNPTDTLFLCEYVINHVLYSHGMFCRNFLGIFKVQSRYRVVIIVSNIRCIMHIYCCVSYKFWFVYGALRIQIPFFIVLVAVRESDATRHLK